MTSDLSQDEHTVLLIAAQGESLAPVGRWEIPVRSLAQRGYLKMLDSVNFVITATGQAAVQNQEAANDRALAQTIERCGEMAAVQKNIQGFAEQAANLLATAGKASAAVTGDDPSVAIDKWSEIIRKRAQDILCTS